MSVAAFQFYDNAFLKVFNGDIDWENDDITAVLVEDTYTPLASSHTEFGDIDEAALATVSAGSGDYKITLTTPEVTLSDSGDEVEYSSAKVLFGSDVTISARYLVLVKGSAGSLGSSDLLIGWVDFGTTLTSSNAEFSYTPADTGWFKIQKSS
jgi:hypothetical protein